MTTSVNEVIFFILLGVFFIIFFMATNYFYVGSNTKKGAMLTVAAIVFSLFFVGYSQLTGVCKSKDCYQYSSGNSDGFHISPGKLCQGGGYMHQGNSRRAKFCRAFAETPEGKEEINRYDCGRGYNGMPGNGFRFTPVSDRNWNNARCDTPGGYDNGIF